MHRLFIATLVTETNTFVPFPTSYRSFEADGYLVHRGQHTAEALEAPFPAAVVRRLAEAENWQVIESLCAATMPSGLTIRSVYEDFRQEILDDLREALPVDAIFLEMHGAMAAAGYSDVEGDLLSHMRAILGPDVPIGLELDPHCHLTKAMLDNASVIVMQKEYPHTDIADRAEDIFRLLVRIVMGEISPHMAVYDCRMIIDAMHTTREPGKSIVSFIRQLEEQEDVLSVSICHGFLWGDMPEMGTKVLVITDNEPEKGLKLAENVGRMLFEHRHDMRHELLSVEDTLAETKAIIQSNPGKPVVIADSTDNPGGGAPGDSTTLLQALLYHGLRNIAIATIWDPIAAQIAIEAGEGAWLPLRIGGKMGPYSGNPIDVYAEVIKTVRNAAYTFAGISQSIGDAAMIRVDGIEIILNTVRRQISGRDVFSNMGIDPTQRSILVVKSSQHFFASFSPIAEQVLYCHAGGALMTDTKAIPYKHINRNKWPFIEDPFSVGSDEV